MRAEDREILQRVCGIIEGTSFFISEGASEALVLAVELIDGVLNKDEKDDE